MRIVFINEAHSVTIKDHNNPKVVKMKLISDFNVITWSFECFKKAL